VEAELFAREGAELAADFRKFVEAAWHIVEPGTTFLDGMHIEAICSHLQALFERKFTKLLINVPPRSGKSTIASVLFPAWVWTHSPEEKILSASYQEGLSMDASVSARRLIESEWYQERWPHVKLMMDQNAKKKYDNTALGRRQITSTDGVTTGLGGTIKILDDPHNVQDVESAVLREGVVQWFREAWSTRQNPGGREPIEIVIMQRVHQNDVSGYILQEGGWVHLCLPLEWDGVAETNAFGWKDPRTEYGQLMWPAVHGTPAGKTMLKALKSRMGPHGVAGQLQQRPVPRGGGTFKKEWCSFWYDPALGTPAPVDVVLADGSTKQCPQKPLPPLDDDQLLHSWDFAFGGGLKNDFVVGQVWARGRKDPGNRYLLAQKRSQMDFVDSKAAVVELYHQYLASIVLIEAKANGPGIMAELRGKIPGIVPVDPGARDKVARAQGVAPMFEGGNVWLPHPEQFPWVNEFLDELCMFPRSTYDDQVDAMTQALHRMRDYVAEDLDLDIHGLGFGANPWVV
jgi:predicted phage terminase large subunit-like protein